MESVSQTIANFPLPKNIKMAFEQLMVIIQSLPEVLPAQLAQKCFPLTVADGVLWLGANDPYLLQLVHLHSSEILAGVNLKLRETGRPPLKGIKSSLIPTRPSSSKSLRLYPKKILSPTEKESLLHCCGSISDGELRRVFQQLLTHL